MEKWSRYSQDKTHKQKDKIDGNPSTKNNESSSSDNENYSHETPQSKTHKQKDNTDYNSFKQI